MSRPEYSLEVPKTKSRPVVIIPYQPRWQTEYTTLASTLREIIGETALRIDHIGSTSVPGLAAKDIIDVQITLSNLNDCDEFISLMQRGGFRKRGDIRYDCLVGCDEDALKKRYYREAEGQRRVHIHVREHGSVNQRYPLLFRDYLRENEQVCMGYQLIKQRLAAIYPDCIDGYLFIKDPLMDIIYQGALHWAEKADWQPDSEYC